MLLLKNKEKRFKVICPFKDFNIVKEDALVIVSNFRIVFKCSYLVSRRVDVYSMVTAFASMSNSTSQYASLTSSPILTTYHLFNL